LAASPTNCGATRPSPPPILAVTPKPALKTSTLQDPTLKK
jgi:hypothetical protein